MTKEHTLNHLGQYQWKEEDLLSKGDYRLSRSLLQAWLELSVHAQWNKTFRNLLFHAAITSNESLAESILQRLGVSMASYRHAITDKDWKSSNLSMPRPNTLEWYRHESKSHTHTGSDIYQEDCWHCYERLPYTAGDYEGRINKRVFVLGEHIASIVEHQSLRILAFVLIQRPIEVHRALLYHTVDPQIGMVDSPDFVQLLLSAYTFKAECHGSLMVHMINRGHIHSAHALFQHGVMIGNTALEFVCWKLVLMEQDAKPTDPADKHVDFARWFRFQLADAIGKRDPSKRQYLLSFRQEAQPSAAT